MLGSEEVWIEQMKDWQDNWGGPAPLCEPPDRKGGGLPLGYIPSDSKPVDVPSSTQKVDGCRCPNKGGAGTWRDRPPML